ncbi:MAG: SMI1/KNR4 family protein [Nevskia sp.]|nr:SMI1/KNR4 family protein [Nevskia sp.]
MTGSATISAFLAFCAQGNPRFIHPIPERTSYEQMLVDLENGDPAVRTAFNWAKQAQNAGDEAVLAEWRRYAAAERASIRRVVTVRHQFDPPPSADALAGLQLRLGDASPDLLELYRQHDGASLFVDTEDDGSGLFFFPVAEMDMEREGVAERLDAPPMETVEDNQLQVFGKPAWFGSAVVFAGFGYAPERLLLPTTGEYRGHVFLFTHDPPRLVRICDSLGALLDLLRQRPVELLGDFGGASYHGASAYQTG